MYLNCVLPIKTELCYSCNPRAYILDNTLYINLNLFLVLIALKLDLSDKSAMPDFIAKKFNDEFNFHFWQLTLLHFFVYYFLQSLVQGIWVYAQNNSNTKLNDIFLNFLNRFTGIGICKDYNNVISRGSYTIYVIKYLINIDETNKCLTTLPLNLLNISYTS